MIEQMFYQSRLGPSHATGSGLAGLVRPVRPDARSARLADYQVIAYRIGFNGMGNLVWSAGAAARPGVAGAAP
jgi:hypothetical protein